MLWVDKYRPAELKDLDFHEAVTKRLRNLAASPDLPHLLVYGPPGAGKKTRILALLRELYGDGALKVRLEHKSFKVPNRSTKVEITTVASNYHIEMNPSDVGATNDRLVVQEVLKEIAQYHLADSNAQRPFKVVLLMEVDRLSKNAQHALRRTMEKYTATCRLVLCCNNPSKVIDPLRSRCLGVRVGAPTLEEVEHVLQGVCLKEGLAYCAPLGRDIAVKSERNLRRAILMLETCRVQKYERCESVWGEPSSKTQTNRWWYDVVAATRSRRTSRSSWQRGRSTFARSPRWCSRSSLPPGSWPARMAFACLDRRSC